MHRAPAGRTPRPLVRIAQLRPVAEDPFRIVLILVDVQNTFCIPGYELYVGGRSGTGAVDDNRRLVQFIYRNLGALTEISATFDTHQAIQIFHVTFLVDENGQHPGPYTLVPAEDVRQVRWRFNPALAGILGMEASYGQRHLQPYVDELQQRGKYSLTIWPFHAMLGGLGHALVSSVDEAIFFHSIALAVHKAKAAPAAGGQKFSASTKLHQPLVRLCGP